MRYQSDFEELIEPWALAGLIVVLFFLLIFAGLSQNALAWIQVSLAAVLGIVGIVYNSRQSRLSRSQAEASLVIDVDDNNVVHAVNHGNVPVQVISVATKTFMVKRAWMTNEVLYNIFSSLHKAWLATGTQGVETVYIKPHENMRLSKDERVTILHPQTGLKGAIENHEAVVQIISFIYKTDLDDTEYRKSIGIFRLTPPAAMLLWRVCQEAPKNAKKVDYNSLRSLVTARGLSYTNSDDIFVETLWDNIGNTNIVDPSFRPVVINEKNLYDLRMSMNVDYLPQNKWIIYRIETKRLD